MRRRFAIRTVRGRTTVVTALLAMGILAMSHLVVYALAWQSLHRALDQMLVSIARAELASALDGPNGAVHVHEDGSAQLSLPGTSGYERFALIRDASGAVIARTSNLTTGQCLQIINQIGPTKRPGNARGFTRAFFHGMPCRVIYYPLHDMRGNPLQAAIGISQEPIHHTLSILLIVLALSFLTGCLLAIGGADQIAARLTRPLERIAAAAEAVHSDNLEEAVIPAVSSDSEIQAVTGMLNGMLARLKETFAAQQRFIADASHELRSPLTALKINLEVTLRRSRSEEQYRESLQLALQEVDHLTRLVNDLLTLSRADAHHLALRREPTDLTTVVERSLRSFAARAETVSVQTAQVCSGPVLLLADPERLREVIDNLLDNALRFSPPCSTVTVTVERESANQAVLRVSDEGPGIPPAERERVFSRFYRHDPVRARQVGSTGLGLAIVRSIVKAHGGTVHVDEGKAGGAVIVVRLPAEPEHALEFGQT